MVAQEPRVTRIYFETVQLLKLVKHYSFCEALIAGSSRQYQPTSIVYRRTARCWSSHGHRKRRRRFFARGKR